jgi:hypothetical protein
MNKKIIWFLKCSLRRHIWVNCPIRANEEKDVIKKLQFDFLSLVKWYQQYGSYYMPNSSWHTFFSESRSHESMNKKVIWFWRTHCGVICNWMTNLYTDKLAIWWYQLTLGSTYNMVLITYPTVTFRWKILII